ncbi:uncharacterized protein LOC130499892 [Raphanus sativus]|uniref:Uncharacterized protein LOC130499892 n=1 Tax=Raphanus sativus TaxID=3726 RepID=A0A9W3CFR9_RAPSA|nr:uncharacterized protein LOC130499892 [Raphanus sativus]
MKIVWVLATLLSFRSNRPPRRLRSEEEAGVIEYNTLLNSLKTRRDSLGSKLSELLEAKEELKEEKLKAKEEAEDLTQEMAELRYKMTCLLDEERKRRVCIEQASLQRIAELEAQAYAIFWPCFFFFFF